MKPDELERLLWEQTDGEISATDRKRLTIALTADPDANHQRHDVAACADLLAAVGEVPVPPMLWAGIERTVAALPRPQAQRSWFASLCGLLVPQRRVRLAWAAAGVVVVVVTAVLLVVDLGQVPGVDNTRFYGSMVPGRSTLSGTETAALPDGLGALTLAQRDGSLLCQLRVDRTVDGGVTLDVTGTGVTVAGFEANGVVASQIASAPDAVGVAVEGVGSASLAVRAAAPPQDVTVRVVASGRTAFERRVSITGEAQR
jgi:hypothetical protein